MGRRHNQHEPPLDQTGPATAYPNRAGAYANSPADNRSTERHCLDATHDYATGTGHYGQPSRRNTSYR